MLEAGGHQGTVSIIQLTAPGCRRGAFGPSFRERTLRVAPAYELLQSIEVKRLARVAAYTATLFVDGEDSGDTTLPFTSRAFQGDDVIGLEIRVFTIE